MKRKTFHLIYVQRRKIEMKERRAEISFEGQKQESKKKTELNWKKNDFGSG